MQSGSGNLYIGSLTLAAHEAPVFQQCGNTRGATAAKWINNQPPP